MQHAKTKHIEIDIHFVRDLVVQKKVKILYCSSKTQLANVLTKPLASPLFLKFRSKLTGLITLSLKEIIRSYGYIGDMRISQNKFSLNDFVT